MAGGLATVGVVAATASLQLLTILLGAAVLGAVGLADDRGGVRPVVKIAVEVGCALALWSVGIRAGLFGVYALDLALTVVWVLAVTNAINMIDNMDGLSSGLAALASLTFFVIAAGRGDYLVASFAVALAGASLGFLRYNFPPASIFLGDAGTLMIGFLLAAVSLHLDLVGNTGLVRAAIPILALAVPLFDMALVVVGRSPGPPTDLRRGHRPFVASTRQDGVLRAEGGAAQLRRCRPSAAAWRSGSPKRRTRWRSWSSPPWASRHAACCWRSTSASDGGSVVSVRPPWRASRPPAERASS